MTARPKRAPKKKAENLPTRARAIDWPADKVERREVSALIPYARNARTHSDEQVAQIAASIRAPGAIQVRVGERGAPKPKRATEPADG